MTDSTRVYYKISFFLKSGNSFSYNMAFTEPLTDDEIRETVDTLKTTAFSIGQKNGTGMGMNEEVVEAITMNILPK